METVVGTRPGFTPCPSDKSYGKAKPENRRRHPTKRWFLQRDLACVSKVALEGNQRPSTMAAPKTLGRPRSDKRGEHGVRPARGQ